MMKEGTLVPCDNRDCGLSGAMPTLAVGMFAGVAKHAHGKRGHGTHSFNDRTVLGFVGKR